jgi:hypothetical protein
MREEKTPQWKEEKLNAGDESEEREGEKGQRENDETEKGEREKRR